MSYFGFTISGIEDRVKSINAFHNTDSNSICFYIWLFVLLEKVEKLTRGRLCILLDLCIPQWLGRSQSWQRRERRQTRVNAYTPPYIPKISITRTYMILQSWRLMRPNHKIYNSLFLNLNCRSKDYKQPAKRQFTNNYPCKEIKEELSVADLMRSSKQSLSNYELEEIKYFPSTVVTFKCSSPEDFRFNQCQGLPCQCKQRYRQVYFQARQTNNCRNWKLIPLTINDGCHCENILK